MNNQKIHLLDESDVIAEYESSKGFSNFQNIEALVFADNSNKFSNWPKSIGRRTHKSYTKYDMTKSNSKANTYRDNQSQNDQGEDDKYKYTSVEKSNGKYSKLKKLQALAKINHSFSDFKIEKVTHNDPNNNINSNKSYNNNTVDIDKIINYAEDILTDIKLAANKQSKKDIIKNSQDFDFIDNIDKIYHKSDAIEWNNHDTAIDWLLKGVPDIFEEDNPIITDEFVEKLLSEGGKPPSQLRFPSIYASSFRLMGKLDEVDNLTIEISHLAIYSSKFGIRRSGSYLLIKPPSACGEKSEKIPLDCIKDTFSSLINAQNQDKRKGISRKHSMSDYFVGAVDLSTAIEFNIQLTNDIINDWLSCSSITSCIRIELYSYISEVNKLVPKQNHPMLFGYVDIPLSGLLGTEELDALVTCQLTADAQTQISVLQRISSLPNGPQMLRSQPPGNKLGSLTIRLSLNQKNSNSTISKQSNEIEGILEIPIDNTADVINYDIENNSKNPVKITNYLNTNPVSAKPTNKPLDLVDQALNYLPVPPNTPGNAWSNYSKVLEDNDRYMTLTFNRLEIDLHEILNLLNDAIVNIKIKCKISKSENYELTVPCNRQSSYIYGYDIISYNDINISKVDTTFKLPIIEIWIYSDISYKLIGLSKCNSNINFNSNTQQKIKLSINTIRNNKSIGYIDLSLDFDNNYDSLLKILNENRSQQTKNIPSDNLSTNILVDSKNFKSSDEFIIAECTTDKISDVIDLFNKNVDVSNNINLVNQTMDKLAFDIIVITNDIVINSTTDEFIDIISNKIFEKVLDNQKSTLTNEYNDLKSVISMNDQIDRNDNIDIHIVEISIDGTCRYNKPMHISITNSNYKFPNDVDGYYIQYNLPNHSHDSLHHESLWWDSECVVLNSRNTHYLPLSKQQLDQLFDMEFHIKLDINDHIFAYGTLKKEILYDIFILPGIYKSIKLDVVTNSNTQFYPSHININISHTIEPKLVRNNLPLGLVVRETNTSIQSNNISDYTRSNYIIGNIIELQNNKIVEDDITNNLDNHKYIDISCSYINPTAFDKKTVSVVIDEENNRDENIAVQLDAIEELCNENNIIDIDNNNGSEFLFDSVVPIESSDLTIDKHDHSNVLVEDINKNILFDISYSNSSNEITNEISNDLFDLSNSSIGNQKEVNDESIYISNDSHDNLIPLELINNSYIEFESNPEYSLNTESTKNLIVNDDLHQPINQIPAEDSNNNEEIEEVNIELDQPVGLLPYSDSSNEFIINHKSTSESVIINYVIDLLDAVIYQMISDILSNIIIEELVIIDKLYEDYVSDMNDSDIISIESANVSAINDSNSTGGINGDVLDQVIARAINDNYSTVDVINDESIQSIARVIENNSDTDDIIDDKIDKSIDLVSNDDNVNVHSIDHVIIVNKNLDVDLNDYEIIGNQFDNSLSNYLENTNITVTIDIDNADRKDINDQYSNSSEQIDDICLFYKCSDIINELRKPDDNVDILIDSTVDNEISNHLININTPISVDTLFQETPYRSPLRENSIFSLTSVCKYNSSERSNDGMEISSDLVSLDNQSIDMIDEAVQVDSIDKHIIRDVETNKIDESIQVDQIEIPPINIESVISDISPTTSKIRRLVDEEFEKRFPNKSVCNNTLDIVKQLPYPFELIESDIRANNKAIDRSRKLINSITVDSNIEKPSKPKQTSYLLSDILLPQLSELRKKALDRHTNSDSNKSANYNLSILNRKYLDEETIRISNIMKEKIIFKKI